MGDLSVKRRKSKSPQVGDMRERVVINKRKMGAPGNDSAAFMQTLTPIATVWAAAHTKSGSTGVEVFNNVSKSNTDASNLFIIRFRSDVTFANIITYKGDNYKILPADNPDKRNRFLFLYCALLGEDDLDANK